LDAEESRNLNVYTTLRLRGESAVQEVRSDPLEATSGDDVDNMFDLSEPESPSPEKDVEPLETHPLLQPEHEHEEVLLLKRPKSASVAGPATQGSKSDVRTPPPPPKAKKRATIPL